MRNMWQVILVLLLMTGPAQAAPSLEQYYNRVEAPAPAPDAPVVAAPAPAADPPPATSGSHVVTSVKKCLQDLDDAAAAAEISRHSLTPYADCQRALAAKARAVTAAEDAAAVPPPAETPRNFRRVSDPARPEAGGAENKTAEETAPSAPKKAK